MITQPSEPEILRALTDAGLRFEVGDLEVLVMRPDGDGLVSFWKDGREWVVAPGPPLSPRTFHASREGALAAIRSALGGGAYEGRNDGLEASARII